MLRRLFPHPYLAAAVPIVWLLLVNTVTLGQILIGLLLALLLPLYTSRFWPDRSRIRRPSRLFAYGLLVLRDILVANIDVARLVLFKRNDALRPAYVAVPLEVRSPEAILLLTATITLTPGTISADLSADGRTVLVHALNVADPDAMVREIKTRYERRIMEIFT